MKVFSCSKMREYLANRVNSQLLFVSFLVALAVPVAAYSQTVPLTFKIIPYSDPDFIGPGRGAEQWQNGSESISNPGSITSQKSMDVYYRFCWTELEDSVAGRYNWNHFDEKMRDAIDHRQKLSFGIMPVYDGEGTIEYDSAKSAYPLYLHKSMQAGSANTKDWVSNGVWIPNWNHSYYLARLRALHTALNAHILASTYKGVPFKNAIYCIDIRGYGNYGEWHNAGIVDHISQYPVGRRATAATLKTIINHHTQVFTQWPLTLMIATFDAEQYDAIMNPAEVAYFALTTRNTWGFLGWRRDQWGATDIYLDKILKNNEKKYSNSPAFKEWITTRYLTSPVTGEPPRYVSPGGSCEYWDLERQLTDYGATSLGNGNWGIKLSDCGEENARAAFKKAGYRIILEGGSITKQPKPGNPFLITLDWKNIGIAPTYENWDVVFELKDNKDSLVWSGVSQFKPKLFAPSPHQKSISDTFELPAIIPVGQYKLDLTIKDPTNYRTPLPLAIQGRNAAGSYTIKDFYVSPDSCVSPEAKVSRTISCDGQTYSLALDSATGIAPYDLVINGTTYHDIQPGQVITSSSQPLLNIWTINPLPKNTEDLPVELGVKFKSSVSGFIKGIRFFSPATPSGKYTGHLWTGSGSLLDSAEFINVTPNGWQEVLFSKPVAIKADTIYVASYHTAGGRYAATPEGLKSTASSGYLTAPGSNDGTKENGIYSYGPSPSFPVNSYKSANYWVDVIFAPDVYRFDLTAVTDNAGCNNSGDLQTVTANFKNNCDTVPTVNVPTATIRNASACSSKTVSLVLDSASGTAPYDLVINGTTYHDVLPGQTIATIDPPVQTVWNSNPVVVDGEDNPVTLGMKFKSTQNGVVKGIRFFSPANAAGTYTGHLWSATGNLLDSAVFASVTPHGWQEVLFTTPIPIQADTTYIVSYHTAAGYYAATPAGLKNSVANGSLIVPGDSLAGGNGVYSYGASASFPTSSYNANNYWVDVIFAPDTTFNYTFSLTSVTDDAGLTKSGNLQTLSVMPGTCDTIPAGNTPTATIRNASACDSPTVSLVLDSASGTAPYDLVINGTTYHNVLPGQTIAIIDPPAQTVWTNDPSVVNGEDAPVTLGMKFKSSKDGLIKGIRFYSPANPAGKYTGHLWSASGQLLDSAVFTNVTPSRWQEVLFATPIPIKAETIYVASYHTNAGHYAATPAGFTNTASNGALSVPGDSIAGGNGVYAYGASSSFPVSSYKANNYWADVIFVADTTYTYTFSLTSVTDNAGLSKTGTLQTLSVTSNDCPQERPAATEPVVEQSRSTQKQFSTSKIPAETKIYSLGQNYPNPVASTTTIEYSVPKPAKVKLLLYDMNGRLIKVLTEGLREPGHYTLNLSSELLRSGVYFYRMQTTDFSAVKKLIIQK